MSDNREKRGRVVVLTALPVEYQAVRTHLNRYQEKEYKGTIYEQGIFSTREWVWEVGIAQIGMGNAGAAFEIERAIACFHPDVVLFIGVAGGIKGVEIGDVVVATKVYGYESGKASRKQFLPRADVGESSYRLVQRAQTEARKKDWMQRIRGRDTTRSATPRVLVGPIASGEKVIASTRSDIFKFLQTTYSDALAVEMEARGFLKATHANVPVQALIIRGISDLLSGKGAADARGSQEIAACHASAFAFEVLARLDPTRLLPASQTVESAPPLQTVQVRQNKTPRHLLPTLLLPPHIPDEPYYQLPGREQSLDLLLSALQTPQGPPAIVIDGLGGMGKTALAVELARRALHQQLFEMVVGDSAKQEQFVDGEIVRVSEASLDFHHLLDSIARQLDHWEIPSLQPEEKDAMLTRLLRQHRYLLLIDNLESVDNAQELVARLRGLLGSSRALVTSRQKVRHDFVQPLSLHELDLEDSLFFIQKDLEQRGGSQLRTPPQEKLVEIWRVTGGAPLAMKLVVAQAMFLDVDIILRQLEQAGSNIYPFIFRQSWEQLSLTAQLILIYIGRAVVTTVSREELEGIDIAESQAELLAATRQLVNYSLLDVYSLSGRTRYGIHQLTRQFVNSDLPKIWQSQE